MVKVNVEPADYYPIIDKLFTEEIVEALDAVGLSVEGIDAKVRPSGDNVGVDFSLVVTSKGNRGVSSMEDFIRIAVERLVEEANGRFRWMGNGKFFLGELKLVEAGETEKRPSSSPRINIEAAPDELKGALEKVAKGLWIKLQERGVRVTSVALSFERGVAPTVTARLILEGNPTLYERKLLAEYISDKIEAYLWTTVGKGDYNINVQLSTPSENEKDDEAPDEEIKNDDLRELLRNLGG
jgi:hypothetical protein